MNRNYLEKDENLLMEKLDKITKLLSSLALSQRYNAEIEKLKILEELVREQIRHEDTHHPTC